MAILLCCAGPGVVRAQSVAASYTIPYQTTLRNTTGGGSTIYRGDAYFKFVIYRQETAASVPVPIWSHDPDYLPNLDPGRPVPVPEPGRMLRLGAPDGVASVYLGGADGVMLEPNGTPSTVPVQGGGTAPMAMSPLDAGAFTGGAVRLRVWMSKSTTSFELLAPDLPLAASPFALRAAVADSVAAKGVTAGALSDELNLLLTRMTTVADSASDADLLAQGFQPMWRLSASPYQRVGQVNPPTGRVNHVAAWTGTELLIFGGSQLLDGAPLPGGTRYRPANDSWSPLPTFEAPSARSGAVAAWANGRWMIWGGVGAGGLLGDGAVLDPVANDWASLPAPPPSFIGRRGHTGVWTGTHWLIWGGLSFDGPMADGAAYNPANGTWQSLPAFPGAARYQHTAVWTGSRMLIWGGQTLENGPLANGYEFNPGANPANGTWKALAASPLAARHSHSAFWTSAGMVVWGGLDNTGTPLGNGAIWGPSTDSWRAVPDASGFLVPAARVQGTATSAGLLLFGGQTASGASGAGAFLDLNTLAWYLTPTPGPAARLGHSVVAVPPANDVLIFGGADPAVTGAFHDLWRLPAERTQYLYRKP